MQVRDVPKLEPKKKPAPPPTNNRPAEPQRWDNRPTYPPYPPYWGYPGSGWYPNMPPYGPPPPQAPTAERTNPNPSSTNRTELTEDTVEVSDKPARKSKPKTKPEMVGQAVGNLITKELERDPRLLGQIPPEVFAAIEDGELTQDEVKQLIPVLAKQYLGKNADIGKMANHWLLKRFIPSPIRTAVNWAFPS